ncbi:MAG: TMEM175 family protein, partial [Methanoregulaceae archaeon]
IFAFSMTLLVVGLDLPDKATLVQSNEFVSRYLWEILPDFERYVIAFFILGAFWMAHHTMHHRVEIVDRTYIWLNLGTLFFITLLPFTTSFSGDFSHVALASVLFSLNLLAIGIGFFLQWEYGIASGRFNREKSGSLFILEGRLRNLVIPGLSVIAIVFALAGSTWAQTAYLLIPVLFFLIRAYSRKIRERSDPGRAEG